jgi:hypothetical protein
MGVMSVLKKLRELWANRNRVSEDDAPPQSRDPREINRAEVGAGGLYGPIAPPSLRPGRRVAQV